MNERLPVKDPTQSITIEFDFSEVTDTPLNPVISVIVECGSVSDASDLKLVGLPQIEGASVLQLVSGGKPFVDYGIRCKIEMLDRPDSEIAAAILPVRNLPIFNAPRTC